MNVAYTWPPNYSLITTVLTPDPGAIFCYGDTIYSPSGRTPPEDIEHHESIHSKQQGANPNGWWERYLTDVDFRLSQELEAYAAQVNFIKKHMGAKAAKDCLDECARNLASPAYALNLTKHQAETRIRRFVV